MTWRPGTPVVSAEDRADWLAWRKDRKREQQRARRACYPRIDYYPSPEAVAVIDRLRFPAYGGDLSSIINRIVAEWADEVPPE